TPTLISASLCCPAPPPPLLYPLSLRAALPISPDKVRAAFTPFERAGRPPGDTVPGIGLGLALSRALARDLGGDLGRARGPGRCRSEEHTSELQSRGHLVCRLLLEKKKKYTHKT